MLAFMEGMSYEEACRLMRLVTDEEFFGHRILYTVSDGIWLLPETEKDLRDVYELPQTHFSDILYVLKEKENELDYQ